MEGLLLNTNKTMSSKEIAELTGKEHKHVARDIKSLILQGAISQPSFGLSEYVSDRGKTYPIFNLDYEATMVLITGYDAKRRSIVIKRWLALEKKEIEQPTLPQTYLEALKALVGSEEDKVALVAEKAVLVEQATKDAPHVEFSKRLEVSNTAVSVGKFSKLLNNCGMKIGRNRLFQSLRDMGYLMSDNEPYQQYVERGFFKVKESLRLTESGYVPCFTTLITGEGQLYLFGKLTADPVKQPKKVVRRKKFSQLRMTDVPDRDM